MSEKSIPLITKNGMHKILDLTYNSKKMQSFITVMLHAQTCKDCAPLFVEAMATAKRHMENELK